MKDKIIELLKQYEDKHTLGVYRGDYDELADEVVKLFCQPAVISSLTCNHNYNQVDTYWNKCTHCGMYAPLRQ